jgi:hypothetical protein
MLLKNDRKLPEFYYERDTSMTLRVDVGFVKLGNYFQNFDSNVLFMLK